MSRLLAEGFGEIEAIHSRQVDVQYCGIKYSTCSGTQRCESFGGHRDIMSPTLNQPSPILSQIGAVIHNQDSESLHRPAALAREFPAATSYTRNRELILRGGGGICGGLLLFGNYLVGDAQLGGTP